MNEEILKGLINIVVLSISASAYYSAFSNSRKILGLFQTEEQPLTDEEQNRLDKLLESGRRYHNLSYVISGILIALSALENFQSFTVPFGNLSFPRLQTALGLWLLVIVLLVGSDRFFLMAYPFLEIDKRRPKFAWIAMGLNFERNKFSGFIFCLPLFISSVAVAVILQEVPFTNGVLQASILSFIGFGLFLLPRTIYYWAYLIGERLDHRGGPATLSMYLLYVYRMLRQIIYVLFLIAPIIFVIPRWNFADFYRLLTYAVVIFSILLIVRLICGTRLVYPRLDKIGRSFGFPIESTHYK